MQEQTLPTAPTPEPLRAAKDKFTIVWGEVEPDFPRFVYMSTPGRPEDLLLGNLGMQRAPGEPVWPVPLGLAGGTCGGFAPDASGRYILYTRVIEGESLLAAPTLPYNSEPQRARIPSLRLLDVESGEDTSFAESGCAPAWNAEGRIAYLQPVDPASQYDVFNLVGRLVVQYSREDTADPWTGEPQPFGRLVWAGDRLLAHRGRPRSDCPYREDLVVLDAPGAVHTLVPGGSLVALSPDGTRALVTRPDGGGAYSHEALIVRIADGAVLARKSLPQWELANLAPGGTWEGDRIFTRIGGTMSTTPPPPTIVILDVSEGGLEIERVINLLGMETGGLGWYDSIYGTRLIGDGDRLGFWVSRISSGGFYGECDLGAHRCLLSQASNGRGFVDSSSRPWPGR